MYNYDTYFNDSDEFIYWDDENLLLLLKIINKNTRCLCMKVGYTDFRSNKTYSDCVFEKYSKPIFVYKVIKKIAQCEEGD